MAKRRTTIGQNPLDAVPAATDADRPPAPAAPRGGPAPVAGVTGRRVFDAWRAGTEAMLRATFDAQNAALSAGLSVVDAAASTNKAALEHWAEVARQAQQAALEAFQANVGSPRHRR